MLMNPLQDCSNYSPLLPHPLPQLRINTSLVFSGQTPYQALRWRLILHCCSALLQNLVGNSGEMLCLERQQAEASVDATYPPLQIVNSVPFLSISILSLSLSQSALFSLFTIPSFSSDQFFVLLRETSSFITFCFTTDTYFLHSVSHHDII